MEKFRAISLHTRLITKWPTQKELPFQIKRKGQLKAIGGWINSLRDPVQFIHFYGSKSICRVSTLVSKLVECPGLCRKVIEPTWPKFFLQLWEEHLLHSTSPHPARAFFRGRLLCKLKYSSVPLSLECVSVAFWTEIQWTQDVWSLEFLNWGKVLRQLSFHAEMGGCKSN